MEIKIRTQNGEQIVNISEISLTEEYLKKNKKMSEIWDGKIKAMVRNPYFNNNKTLKKQAKKELVEKLSDKIKIEENPHYDFIKRQLSY